MMSLHGHEVDYVHYCRKKVYNRFPERESNGYRHIFERASGIDSLVRHLKRMFNGKYDIVYANTLSSAFISTAGRLVDVPLVFDMHGAVVEEVIFLNREFGLSYGFLRKLATTKVMDFFGLMLSDKIVCVSKGMVGYLEGKGIPSSRLAHITNGVDLNFFAHKDDLRTRRLRAELGFGEKLVFGYVGRDAKWQGIESLVKAAEIVKGRDIGFLIVGSAQVPNKDNIRVIPRVPHSQIREYYDACDVLVLPRPKHIVTEVAAPTKFAEYVAMGKPILITPVGDAAELTKQFGCGIIVRKDDAESIAQGVCDFSDLKSEELGEMGRNSRRLAELVFDWNKIGADLEQVIEDVHRV
jgi:glycosyltransferase involved in cell wall biosynthesis